MDMVANLTGWEASSLQALLAKLIMLFDLAVTYDGGDGGATIATGEVITSRPEVVATTL